MERHKCKLCSRTFANGRALGGHMKAHLATLPLPPKPQPLPTLSYSSQESEDKKENPKKSSKLADPEFSFAAAAPDTGSAVVQDRESESESESKNPTRQRSKRNRKSRILATQKQNSEEGPMKKAKMEPAETEPVVSSISVSDGRAVEDQEEDVAMCLMMLSRDTWRKEKKNAVQEEQEGAVKRSAVDCSSSSSKQGIKFKKVRGRQQCGNCGKTFRTSRALGSHRSICCRRGDGGEGSERIFECPFCFKVFGSGQALGGHKRSHLMGIAPSSPSAAHDSAGNSRRESLIDLNLPAPTEEEDDELSAVSDC